MKGLEVIQRLTNEIVNEVATQLCEQDIRDIFEVLKRSVCEINQVVMIDRPALPVDEKEADKYRGYAKGAAFQKMAMEGLHQVCHEESEYDSMRDEETKTYRVFVIKP